MSVLSFDTRGNDKQKLCAKYWHDNSITDIAYGGSKGSAKSYTGCALLSMSSIRFPESMWFIARRELNDMRKFTKPSMFEVLQNFGIKSSEYKFNGQDNFFEFSNGSKIFFLPAKHLPSDPLYQRFGSMQMTGGWIEEAGEFPKAAKNNLMASIGRWKNDLYEWTGTLLQTCNPSKNYLYSDYYKKHKKGDLESWKRFVQALPTDNKMLSDEYLLNLERTLDTNEKKRLLHGNWEFDDDPYALCDYDDIEELFNNDLATKNGDIFLTADIARFGSDKAIILVYNNWTIIDKVVLDISKTTEIQSAINHLRQKYNISRNNCIADEDGVGGGVVDNCGIKGFSNNSKPIDTSSNKLNSEADKRTYDNLKSQCGFYLAERISLSQVSWESEISENQKEEITEELEQLKRDPKKNKLALINKDSMKSNLGRSPDWLDNLIMRSYFDLKPKKRSFFGAVIS